MSTRSVLTSEAEVGATLQVPINHFEGAYTWCATLDRLRSDDQVVLRYVDNPNGSIDDIAGVCNEAGTVVGLMPHPERASELLGSSDGLPLLRSVLAARPGGSLSEPDVGAQAPRPMPACFSTAGVDARLAPGGVADALAGAVGRGLVDELGLDAVEVDLLLLGGQLGGEVLLLLEQVEPRERVGGRRAGRRSSPRRLDRLRGALTTALALVDSSASRYPTTALFWTRPS